MYLFIGFVSYQKLKIFYRFLLQQGFYMPRLNATNNKDTDVRCLHKMNVEMNEALLLRYFKVVTPL